MFPSSLRAGTTTETLGFPHLVSGDIRAIMKFVMQIYETAKSSQEFDLQTHQEEMEIESPVRTLFLKMRKV